MRDYKYINKKVWDALEKENTKAAKKVLKWLDRDGCLIVEYSGAFYFEAWQGMPNYVYFYLRRFIPKITGLKYILEDIPL